MSYSTHVYLHGYCSSFIIILLISSLSDTHLNSLSFHHCSLFLSSQLSLSLISTLSQFITKPISFSFFFKISGFKDEDNDSSAEISRATDWVQSASLSSEWVRNADQPLWSNNPFGNGDDDKELIEHGGQVDQSCCDCDYVVVVVIVVVEDRWINGRILLLWKIGESLLLSLLLWLLLWKIGESVAGFCWRVASWVWVWTEKTRWEREGNNKKCKKNEYFIK